MCVSAALADLEDQELAKDEQVVDLLLVDSPPPLAERRCGLDASSTDSCSRPRATARTKQETEVPPRRPDPSTQGLATTTNTRLLSCARTAHFRRFLVPTHKHNASNRLS